MIRSLSACAQWLCAAVVALSIGAYACADPVNGTLFYTTFSGQPNVHSVDFNFNGVTFTLSNIKNIASTPGADGIIFAPSGQLLVGGQNTGLVHMVNPGTGTFVSVSSGVGGAFHLSLQPSLTTVLATNIPGSSVGIVPLSPFSSGSSKPIVGNDTVITSIAYVGGQGYYTTAGAGGTGNFGKVNETATQFVTTRILTGVPAAHGMIFDPFTGDLLLFGDSHISQVDPTLNAIISDRFFPGEQFDQGSADGKGHIFVASNGGDLLFVDYQATGLIGDPSNFTSVKFLAANLDDVAPLAGLGSGTVPEPTSMVVFVLGSLGVAFRLRRLRPIST